LTSYGQETEPESEAEERSRTEEKYTQVEKIESDQYPIVIDPDFTIREIVLSKSGEVDIEVNSVSGNFFEIPLNGNVISTDKFNADKIVITDRSNNSDLILGYVAGT